MSVDDPLGNPDADSGEEDSDFMPEKCQLKADWDDEERDIYDKVVLNTP